MALGGQATDADGVARLQDTYSELVLGAPTLARTLDLALAILKDSNGVIDIGLPVRGDLANPEFDYGAVIAKAIGNLLAEQMGTFTRGETMSQALVS